MPRRATHKEIEPVEPTEELDQIKDAFPDLEENRQEEIALLLQAKGTKAVDAALERINEIIEGHGIESVTLPDLWIDYYQNIALLYVNMGDPYVATVWYDTEERAFGIGGYGDWVEEHPDSEESEEEEE